MNDLLEIIGQRSTPGVLIFDRTPRLLYANSESLKLIPGLASGSPELLSMWEDIVRLIERLKNGSGEATGEGKNASPASLLAIDEGRTFSLRASCLGSVGEESMATHVMVLVERVIEKHTVNLNRVGKLYCLSKRELQVLDLVCLGFMNRDIGERLFISEYTVKDHMKKIMKKMGVGSRSEIAASVQ